MIKTYKNRICCFILAAFFLSACSKIHFIEFEPVYVRANAKGANVYRGSYEKLTDIVHTNLSVAFNWDSAFVYGKAEITAKPYFYPSDELILDAKGFKINSIRLKQGNSYRDLEYSYSENKIKINLDRMYNRDEQYIVAIDYIAMPQKLKVGKDIFSPDDRGLYFINPKGKGNKPQQIWTQGETENNSAWFPTIEDPAEKMTHHFNITVDKKFKTLSNGRLKNSVDHQDGTRTDFWEMNQPHAVYLSMLAVGDFAITTDSWQGKQVNYYTEPKYASSAKKVFGNTPEMMSFFSDILNYPYPWDGYNQVVVRDFVSGAMENTTASVFYEGLNLTTPQHADNNRDDIIAHELFHHWFGNLVTCESWANLTLNEAFATYAEYLWREYKNGKGDAEYHLTQDARAYFGQVKNNKDEKVIRFDYADKEQMFDAISYAKGGLILHTLRQEVGDAAFFASLNLYLRNNAFKTAEIHDLRLAFEEVTGKDLNWFFNQWFLASGYPQLNIDKSYDATNQQVVIKVSQTQDTLKVPVYRLPLVIKTLKDTGLVSKKIYLDKLNQEFRMPLAQKPQFIQVDVNNLLVKVSEPGKSAQEYSYQYQFADNFMERYEAVKYFNANRQNEFAEQIFRNALTDEAWPIIYLGLLNFKYTNSSLDHFDRVAELAQNHYNSLIRAEAVKILKKYYADKITKEIHQDLKNDESLLVKKALK